MKGKTFNLIRGEVCMVDVAIAIAIILYIVLLLICWCIFDREGFVIVFIFSIFCGVINVLLQYLAAL